MNPVLMEVTESEMIAEVMEACEKPSRRGVREETIAGHLLLATAIRLFMTVGEDRTEALLSATLQEVKSGDFALMLEQADLIERVPTSR